MSTTRVPISVNKLLRQLVQIMEQCESTPGEKKVFATISGGELDLELFVKQELDVLPSTYEDRLTDLLEGVRKRKEKI